ncbi:MAG TPA: hypothetical protein VK752_08860 [Bryobacteraceae bacterium]|nr:hypothetical protein [Bryobacteraceae bacterium]
MIDDLSSAVEAELRSLVLGKKVSPGASVAVACGSRRIANHPVILKTVVDHLKGLKARPFLVPAMGLDAGGTAEGQLRAMSMFGITEETVGAEIRSSMDAEVVGHLPEGVPVYCDRHALGADHIFVVNRVRPHSALDGAVQSGLLKMLAMGLGKEVGARVYHSALATMPFADLARGVWNVILDTGRLLAGLMLVENGQSETARIQAAPAENFADAELKMLRYASALFPALPFHFIDILLVDEMGATFGCRGVDLNVVGRKQPIHETGWGKATRIRTLVFRDLHPAAMGNAIGIGHADLVRSRLVTKMDSCATRLNALALTIPGLAAIPIHFETDREILDAALSMAPLQPREKARIVWIRNTSSLTELECSEPFLEEVTHWKDLTVASQLHPLDFDARGNLRDFVIA